MNYPPYIEVHLDEKRKVAVYVNKKQLEQILEIIGIVLKGKDE